MPAKEKPAAQKGEPQADENPQEPGTLYDERGAVIQFPEINHLPTRPLEETLAEGENA